MSPTTGAVVVGVDGSESAIRAARWAGATAHAVGAPLHVLHALSSIGRNLTETAAAITAALMTYQRDAVQIHLNAAVDAVRADGRELTVTTEATDTPADEALLAASRDARLIVLGGDEVNAATALILGSTTLRVATHAASPVAVYRGSRTEVTGQPIVVGVDGSEASASVLGTAFEYAAAWGVKVVVVRALHPGPIVDVTSSLIDWDALEAMEWAELNAAVDGWRRRYPDVEAECVLESATAARALLQHAAEAQLVVVGSRGRNPLTGLLLGSTSMNMLHHSPVPVMVDRGERAPAG